jgi:hypothetical protein
VKDGLHGANRFPVLALRDACPAGPPNRRARNVSGNGRISFPVFFNPGFDAATILLPRHAMIVDGRVCRALATYVASCIAIRMCFLQAVSLPDAMSDFAMFMCFDIIACFDELDGCVMPLA